MTQKNEKKREFRRWEKSEEDLLIRTAQAFPSNLAKCFLLVSQQIDRTDKAVAAHWYTKTSRDPNVMCFFTASAKHIARNRKNGVGVPSSNGIWRKLVAIIRNIC